MMNKTAAMLLQLVNQTLPIRVTFTDESFTQKKNTMMQLLTLSMDSEMFILNDAAKNDPAVQLAIQAYTQRLKAEEQQRQAILSGEYIPQPTTVWNISDRD